MRVWVCACVCACSDPSDPVTDGGYDTLWRSIGVVTGKSGLLRVIIMRVMTCGGVYPATLVPINSDSSYGLGWIIMSEGQCACACV